MCPPPTWRHVPSTARAILTPTPTPTPALSLTRSPHLSPLTSHLSPLTITITITITFTLTPIPTLTLTQVRAVEGVRILFNEACERAIYPLLEAAYGRSMGATADRLRVSDAFVVSK